MKRRKFLSVTGVTIAAAGVTTYLFSDKTNFTRADTKDISDNNPYLTKDEKEILSLAALAPSGHNTQPWFVKYIAPYHWVIGNDKSRWLNAVDPTQRETILSIGAFLQNLEYAAGNLGYQCNFHVIATNNQEPIIGEMKLVKQAKALPYEIKNIIHRRTVRSNYLGEVLKKEDNTFLAAADSAFIHYIPNTAKEHTWLNEQTIEANRIQVNRDAAQAELAVWMRFSSRDAENHADGLTLAGMEVDGISGWILRNFYGKENVLKKSFRDQSIDKVVMQVSQSAGWLLITSKDNAVTTLLDTGKRMQRLFLKVRSKNIAIHPMTQIIEEAATNKVLNNALGISDPVQFILRTGYLKNYPEPVTLRRSVNSFVRL